MYIKGIVFKFRLNKHTHFNTPILYNYIVIIHNLTFHVFIIITKLYFFWLTVQRTYMSNVKIKIK